MKPVFGTPTGTGVLPTGGMAMQTPRPRTSGYFGFRWCLSVMTKPRRQHHRILHRKLVDLLGGAVLVDFLDNHLVGFDLLDLRVADPFDVPVAHFAFEQALCVPHPVEAQMADIGFGRDKGHRHLVADLPLAQLCLDDHRGFIGRAVTGGALNRAHNDGARIVAECLERLVAGFGMIDVADRLREPAMWPKAFDFIEGQFRAGRDDKVVVVDKGPVTHAQALVIRLDLFGRADDQLYVALFHRLFEVDNNVFAISPANQNPRVRGHELVEVRLIDRNHFILSPDFFPNLVSGDHTAQTCTQYNDLCHGLAPWGTNYMFALSLIFAFYKMRIMSHV